MARGPCFYGERQLSSHASELRRGSKGLKEAERQALRLRIQILQGMTPGERFHLGGELYDLGMDLMLAGARKALPGRRITRRDVCRSTLPDDLRKEFEAFLRNRRRSPKKECS
jgi:hypothetical protein